MAYPVPFSYDDERTERRDFEYLRSMYPDIPKQILPYVEEECDRLDYEGSMLYDEYPDKYTLYHLCSKIHKKIEEDNEKIHFRFDSD